MKTDHLINIDGITVTNTKSLIYHHLENETPLNPYKLSSGIVLATTNHLDMGGTLCYEELGNLVQIYKKKPKYNKCLEWCSGMGAFGFHLLGLGLCDQVVFNDYYDYATYICELTAKNNEIQDKVSVYTTPNISKIPKTEKWDLIVGNPPHNWKSTEIDKMGEIPIAMYDNISRQIDDIGMETHNAFFSHIQEYITGDADLFIIAFDTDPCKNWADMANLEIANMIKMSSQKYWTLVHYKPK